MLIRPTIGSLLTRGFRNRFGRVGPKSMHRQSTFERLERRAMLAAELAFHHLKMVQSNVSAVYMPVPRYAPVDATIASMPAVQYRGDFDQVKPMIAVGDPNGSPPVSISSRTDPNVPTSPFAGVASLSISSSQGSFICSGTLLSATHVVTAAHCLDIDDNGSVDVSPNQVTVFFNHNNPSSNNAGSTSIVASALVNHPNYTGFLAPSVNDDIAVVTLSSPAPAGVPIYPINTSPFTSATQIVLAGYGTRGDAIGGAIPNSANFFIKLTGQNVASQFELDDEGSGVREVWLADFDGPAPADLFRDGTTLGNDKEITILGGDSGGPSFIWTDTNSNTTIEQGELTWWGNNTFGSTLAPNFNTSFGGMVGSAYLPFLEAVFNGETPPPPPGDPDDQISEAISLSLPASVSGAIDNTLDVDMYSFTVVAGQRLGFDIDRPSGSLDSGLRLFDSAGNQLALSDDNAGPSPEFSGLESYIEFTFPTSGTYYIGVSSYSNFSYSAVTGGGDANGSSTGTYDLIINEINPINTPPGAVVPFFANFESFTGSGFAPTPTAGQLDSDFWRVTGLSDGAGTFGGTHITGDFARGTSPGGVTTSGVYAFNTGSNVILGVQPSGSDFTPGSITLKVTNTTGSTISNWDIGYDIFALNNEARSNSLYIEYSTNDTNYTRLSALDYLTPGAANALGWTLTPRGAVVNGVSVVNGGSLFLRWSSGDVSGSGSRDEFGIDNVRVTELSRLSALTIEPSSMSENGGTAIATVTRTGSTVGDLVVSLVSNDTTEATVPASVTILNGQASATFTITAVDDAIIDGTQTVTITATAVGFTNVIDTIDVLDNELPPNVSLSVVPTDIAENGGVATVTATLSTVTTFEVVVNLSLSGTATFGDDYSASGSVIIIPAGSLTGSINITGIDDSLVEGTETVIVDITTTANAVELGQQQVTINILDDDVPLDTTPPTITAVYVSGSGWSQTFIDAVDGGGTGSGNGLGVELLPNLKIPTQGVNTIIIQFSESVIGFGAGNVALLGVGIADYMSLNPAPSVQYDPVSFRGTIVLNAPVSADRIRLAVNDAVTDPSGNKLDGNGDANAGGIYDILFDVLVGDANGDGSTDGGDIPIFASAFGSIFGDASYNPLVDWNSDGSVDGGDLPGFANNFGNAIIPGVDPAEALFGGGMALLNESVDSFFKVLGFEDEDEESLAGSMLF